MSTRVSIAHLVVLADFDVPLRLAVAGLIGIAAGFNLNLLSGAPASASSIISKTAIIGLSLAVLPSLVHAVLGFSSLNHAIRNK